MPYGTLALDAISTSGNLEITGNVSTSGNLSVPTIKSTTSSPPTVQNSSGTQIGVFCRAWVNFNGTGTIAIRAAFNVSSITDYGAGRYQANFTNELESNVYVTMGTNGRTVDDAAALTVWDRASNKTTQWTEVNSTYSTSGNNGYADYESINIVVFA